MVDHIEMERPQPGHSHDQGKRINMRYQYPDHGNVHSDNFDMRSHIHHLQQKIKKMNAEQIDLRAELDHVKEERDKSSYIYAQHTQLKHYVQSLKYEKEQLDQVKTEQEKTISRLLDELNRARSELECLIQDKDGYKYKLTELQREKQRLTEKLQSISPNYEMSRSMLEQKNLLANTVAELKTENAKLKEELEQSLSSKSTVYQTDLIKLKDTNKELTRQVEELQHQLDDFKSEAKSLKKSNSETNVEETDRGRSEEDQQRLFTRSHSNSTTDMKSFMRTDKSKKHLSSSFSNLLEEKRTDFSVVPQLQTQLNKAFRDKESLSHQVSEMREVRVEMESRVKSLEVENESLKEQLSKMKAESATAQEEIKVVKGMSLQQTTETYEKSMQLQTQIFELQTERTLAEKQRDIALRERDRVLADAIQVKKKLETIKNQRQKDAKELAAMRKLKDRTVQESQDSIKQAKDMKESLQELEKQKTELVEEIKAIAATPSETEAKKLLTIIKQRQNDYASMLKLLFGREKVDDINSSVAVNKLETLFREKSNLLVEIEDLQRSASKQNEEYIFDLKQTIESLYMEQDTLQGKNRSLISRIGKLEIERDKLRQECERLDRQCQDLNATITFPSATGDGSSGHHSTNTDNIEWGETWEMRHVQIPLCTEGKAGFSVVGGKDQPQLPNPGAFIVTTINKGGPADGVLKVGDVLEYINGHALNNAQHAQAVAVVKESKGLLDIVLRRRKNAHALQVGVAGAVMELGESKKKKKTHDFSLMIQKEGVGFNWEWETHYSVTDITEGGPADKILQLGDRIIQINGVSISKEKPSSIKKMLKSNKGVVRVVIEREDTADTKTLVTKPPPLSITEVFRPITSGRGSKSVSGGSDYSGGKIKDGSSWGSSDDYTDNSQDQHASCRRSTSYHSATQESNASQEQEPVKIEGTRTHLRTDGRFFIADAHHRPTSDGVMYSGYPNACRRVDFEEMSSEIGSTGYSEGVSESFLSEPSTYPDGYMPLDSSQTSIELTFHSVSQVSHNRLTVQSTISTQPEKDNHSDEDESYFARDDGTRTTFRTRSGSDGSASLLSDVESLRSLKKSSKLRGSKFGRSKKSWKSSGSLSQLSEPQYDQYVDPKKRSRSKSMLAIRGKSRSNLSLTGARSMTSVQEEPRRSTSSTSVTHERDPLSDATYIRANFSYIPRLPQELHIQPGDVFHIIEDAPVRYRNSFWVSRLNEDGTDAGVGAIPNTSRAHEWLNEQGNPLDIALYEEVEAYTGTRPVLICGVLANQITHLLVESYPKLFHYCHPNFVERQARITEARLHREQSEGRIIHYERHGDTGFAVIPREAFTSDESRGKHVLVGGSIASLHCLKSFAPPISILVKAGAEDSINTFGPDKLSQLEVQRMYAEARTLEEEHSHEFTACLMLVFEDTLLRQIADIVRSEKLNQTWVTIARTPISP